MCMECGVSDKRKPSKASQKLAMDDGWLFHTQKGVGRWICHDCATKPNAGLVIETSSQEDLDLVTAYARSFDIEVTEDWHKFTEDSYPFFRYMNPICPALYESQQAYMGKYLLEDHYWISADGDGARIFMPKAELRNAFTMIHEIGHILVMDKTPNVDREDGLLLAFEYYSVLYLWGVSHLDLWVAWQLISGYETTPANILSLARAKLRETQLLVRRLFEIYQGEQHRYDVVQSNGRLKPHVDATYHPTPPIRKLHEAIKTFEMIGQVA